MMPLVASALLATGALAQVPFSLDTTFRTTIQDQYVNSIVVLPSGELLLSGMMRFPGDFIFRGSVRLLSNGQKDPSFAYFTGAGKLTPWNDHFYVFVGQEVQRLLPTGQPDATFIGLSTGPYFSSLQGGDYHVYPDGRVLISGAHLLDDAARGFVGEYDLIWFSNTGYLDTTRIHRKGNGTVWFFEQLPDAGFICHHTGTQFDGVPVDRIFRTDSLGVPDTTFNSNVNTGQAFDYLPWQAGRILVGGNFKRSNAPTEVLQLVRFMPDGSLDPTFNNSNQFGGEGLSGVPKVNRIVPFGSDKLFAVGHFRSVNGEPRGGICVVDTAGQLLPHFDACGAGLVTYMGLTAGSIVGIMPTSDSLYYYIWGTYTGYSDGTTTDPLQRFVSRLHVGDFTTSVPPLSSGEGPGVRVYPNPSTGPFQLSMDQLPPTAQLVVLDALGRTVLQRSVRSHYTTMDLSAQGPGVYLLCVLAGNERLAAMRVVVQ